MNINDPVCWLAYYSDFSGMAAFNSELDALRYAVDNNMHAMPIQGGVDIREQASR